MRIAHLTSNDARTGGAQSLMTLHRALAAAGHESRVFCSSDDPAEPGVGSVPRGPGARAVDSAVRRIAESAGFPSLARPSFRRVLAALRSYAPDVVHLHWTYQGVVIPMLGIPRLSAEFPLVWTFHDMWAFTGGCTNSRGCDRWLSGCGSCPQYSEGDVSIGSMMPLTRDTTGALWRLKRRTHRASSLSVVAPSTWMQGCCLRSPMCEDHALSVVPNAVDTDVFRPLDREMCRSRLGLAPEDRVVLYAGKPDSVAAYSGRLPVFVEAIRRAAAAAPASRLRLLTVGAGGERLTESTGVDGVHLGSVEDRSTMAEAYNAADVFVTTTQFDNLPGVVLEAACCGTAIVASAVGGIPDIVEDGRTGILCRPDAPAEFAEAIGRLLEDRELRDSLAARAAQSASERYAPPRVVGSLVAVYGETLEARSDRSPEGVSR